MGSLDGRIALVTGGSAGIGRATALELARRGARVALHHFRNRDGALATARELGGGEDDLFAADLAAPAACATLVDAVERRFGRIDVLVNNAGDQIARQALDEVTEEIWRRTLDVNLTSTMFVTQAAARGMIERRRGAIVNMASLAAWAGGSRGQLAYAASKGAVVTLTKALAKELAPHGVRVNCVAPGLIDETAFHRIHTPPAMFETIKQQIPLGRAGLPDEVAQAIAFLADDASSFLVGETIDINGGARMR